jgi:TolB protein
VFVSGRDDPDPLHCAPQCIQHVFIMRPDGTHIQRLTSGPVRDLHPVLSPDGRFIAFGRGQQGLFVMRSDGSHLARIPSTGSEDYYPSWSPDGAHLFYQRQPYDQPSEPWSSLWIVDVRSGDVSQLGLQAGSASAAAFPTWSVDGRIAFIYPSSPASGYGPICWVQLGLSTLHCPVLPDQARFPAWSPDGTQIAFEGAVDGQSDIYVMNADGSHIRRLTDDPARDSLPGWSPDGAYIVFNTDRTGHWSLAVMRSDGTGQVLLPGGGAAGAGTASWGS